MSVNINFPFSASGDYTFDASKIEIGSGKAKLKLVDNPGQHFIETFDSPTGFTYDNTKSEFVAGKLQQKDMRPVNATFYAAYTASINASWSTGVGTGAAYGGAAVLAGKLDLAHADLRYVQYATTGNFTSGDRGCIRFKVTPNYSGNTPTTQNFIWISNNVNNNNSLSIQNETGGYLTVTFRTPTGATLKSITALWSPVSGTEYEFELDWDIVTQEARLFINGVKFLEALDLGAYTSSGCTHINLGTQAGKTQTSNFKIDDVLIFSTVQHTANYTPSWTNIYETIYIWTYSDFPIWTYSGAGQIQSLTPAITISEGSEKWVIEGYWWNGSIWVISDKTYAQANTAVEIAAHVLELIALIGFNPYPINTIIFQAGNTQSWIDNFNVEYTGQIYPTDNPTVEINSKWYIDALDLFSETATKIGTDQIKYILKKGTKWYYWNGSAWVESNGTYTQASTAAEIEAHKTSFITSRVLFGIKLFLHSTDGTTTPEIDLLSIDYDYAGESPDTIDTCIVWGYLIDNDNTASDDQVIIFLNKKCAKYKTNILITKEEIRPVVRDDGYFEVELVETVNMDADTLYEVRINGKHYTMAVPVETENNINELLVEVAE